MRRALYVDNKGTSSFAQTGCDLCCGGEKVVDTKRFFATPYADESSASQFCFFLLFLLMSTQQRNTFCP